MFGMSVVGVLSVKTSAASTERGEKEVLEEESPYS